eukprot:gene8295-1565_t
MVPGVLGGLWPLRAEVTRGHSSEHVTRNMTAKDDGVSNGVVLQGYEGYPTHYSRIGCGSVSILPAALPPPRNYPKCPPTANMLYASSSHVASKRAEGASNKRVQPSLSKCKPPTRSRALLAVKAKGADEDDTGSASNLGIFAKVPPGAKQEGRKKVTMPSMASLANEKTKAKAEKPAERAAALSSNVGKVISSSFICIARITPSLLPEMGRRLKNRGRAVKQVFWWGKLELKVHGCTS